MPTYRELYSVLAPTPVIPRDTIAFTLPPPTPRPLRAVGAYIYAGGFTVGVRRAGFEVNVHLEDPKPYASHTAQRNLPGIQVRAFPNWNDEDFRDIDLVYANPPCKAFSALGLTANLGSEAWKDKRLEGALQCTYNVVDLLTMSPKVLIWESVLGAIYRGASMIDQLWRSVIMPNGYHLTIIPHNAYYHGSVQDRTRVLFVCHKNELRHPETHYDRHETVQQRLSTLTDTGDVLPTEVRSFMANQLLHGHQKHGESLRDTFERLRKQDPTLLPNGGVSLNARGQVAGRPGLGCSIKLRPHGRCNVVAKAPPFVHPTAGRYCTLREMSVLADFPPDWVWPTSSASAVREMARGVSSRVGEWAATLAKMTIGAPTLTDHPKVTWLDLRHKPDKRVSLARMLAQRKMPADLFGLEHSVRREVMSGEITPSALPVALATCPPDTSLSPA